MREGGGLEDFLEEGLDFLPEVGFGSIDGGVSGDGGNFEGRQVLPT